MTLRRFSALLPTAALVACASSGEPSPPPVPVFFEAEAVPCAYTVLGRVSEEAAPERDFERLARRVLGRAGAQRGADAVLVERDEGFTVQRIDFGDPRPADQRITLGGDLLRYTDASCGGGA